MRRDSERRKEAQKAEYRNRKKGMETGRTEEERSTGGTADRGEREEGKGKSGKLSSQNRNGSGRKKAEERGKPESESKREAPVEQLWERNREG